MTIHFLGTPLLRPSWAVHDGILYIGMFPQVVAAAASHPAVAGKTILDNPQFVALFQQLGRTSSQPASPTSICRAPRRWCIQPGWRCQRLRGRRRSVRHPFAGDDHAAAQRSFLNELTPAGTVSWVDDAGWHSAGVTPFPGADGHRQRSECRPSPLLRSWSSILLPSLNRARETANRVKCASNERQIGQAILLYSNDHRGKYPPDLGTLIKEEDITPEVFTCPSSNNDVPPAIMTGTKDAQAAWVNANSSYVYVGKAMNQHRRSRSHRCFMRSSAITATTA